MREVNYGYALKVGARNIPGNGRSSNRSKELELSERTSQKLGHETPTIGIEKQINQAAALNRRP